MPLFKAKLILFLVKAVVWCTIVGIGIWYLSHSLDGAVLTYTSVDKFLTAAGVQNDDISSVNGCFLCGYIEKLFHVLGNATETFWLGMLKSLWLIIVIGFGVFMIFHTIKHLYEASKTTSKLTTAEKKLEFKAWFDTIWKRGVRIMIVGVLIGALGMGGTGALKTITNITIKPVMWLGSELSMAATGMTSAANCYTLEQNSADAEDILNPVLQPFMCVIGNINAVTLAGAAGGFALMNYAWLGLGGGLFTWLSGFSLVLMFLFIGFNLFFQILSVIFKLIFIIIFLPLLLAASAFEGIWAAASGLVDKAVNMLVSSAVRIVAITLKVLVVYATVSYAADMYYPPKRDGYSAILPPLIGQQLENPDSEAMSVMRVFSYCEEDSLEDGKINKDLFVKCFYDQKTIVEKKYPQAFDFLRNGWEFFVLMASMFFLYYYAISPKIDKLLGKDGEELFDFGQWIKDIGSTVSKIPATLTEKITSKIGTW